MTDGSGRRSRGRRLSARARLTLTFTGLLFVVGATIVASVVAVMRFVPRYDIVALRPADELVPVDVPPAMVPRSTGPGAIEPGSVSPDGAAGEPWPVTVFGAPLTIEGEGDLLRVLITTSLVVFVLALAAGAWLSWLAAGRLLRPLDHLTDAARTAELGEAGRRPALARRRLAAAGPHDEFDRLASTFDAMLERLDTSFRAQQRFAANASHELRTPLATTQAMLDVALADPEAVDVERLGRRLRETNTRSLRTVEALLTLADATDGRGDDRPVDLRALVVEAVSQAEPIAAADGTRLVVALDDVPVEGDGVLLAALVTNLLDNALRHGQPGGTIEVALRGRVLTVSNDGDPLDPDEIDGLTEAFRRGAGRVAGRGGHGLGLAIVSAVCERHGALLGLTPRPDGGLRVSVAF